MKFKRLISLIMSAVMVVMLCSTAAFAAKKGVALNKISASVTVGKSITLKPTVTGVKNYTLQWCKDRKRYSYGQDQGYEIQSFLQGHGQKVIFIKQQYLKKYGFFFE